MYLIKRMKSVRKRNNSGWSKQKRIFLFYISGIKRRSQIAIKMDPHQSPRIFGAAFVGIRAAAVDPRAAAFGDRKAGTVESYGSAAADNGHKQKRI